MNDFTILSNQVETCIQELIDQTFQNEDLRNIFPNRLLREDVLDLLDRYCTVVYYPWKKRNATMGSASRKSLFQTGRCTTSFLSTRPRP